MNSRVFLFLVVALSLSFVPTARVWSAHLQPLESPAAGNSLAPRLTALDERRAILTWLERNSAGHRFRYAVIDQGQFSDPGTIHEGAGFFANWADTPGLAASSDGTWIAHWLQRSGNGKYAYDVMVSGSRDRGQTWSAPFSPHSDQTKTEHGFVSYFPSGSHGIGMVWLDGRLTRPAASDHAEGAHHGSGEGAMTLRSAVVGVDGREGESMLIDSRVCDCCGTSAGQTDEGPVVIYRGRSKDEIRDIQLARKTANGWTDPVLVHNDGWQTSACPVNGPALLARDQTIIVAWFTMADDNPRVRIARSGDGGRSFAAPIDFNIGEALGRVDLTWTESGYALSWLTQAPAGSTRSGLMRLAWFTHDGELLESHDLLQADDGPSGGFPEILHLGKDQLLVTWTDKSGDGPHGGVSQVHVGLISR